MSSAPPPGTTPSPPPPIAIPPVTPSTPPPPIAPPPVVRPLPPPPPIAPPPVVIPIPPPPPIAVPPLTPSPPPPTAVPPVTPSPPIPVTPSPPPPSTDLTSSPPPPSSPLTPSPPSPSTPLTSSPPPPSPTTPSTPLPSSPPPPSSPLTPSPRPPSPSTPPGSSPPPPSPSTPTPPRSGTRSPPPPPSPSGGGSPTTPSITPSFSPPPPSSSSPGLSTGVVVGIAIGGVAVLVVLTLIFFLCKKKRRRDDEAPPPPNAGGHYGGQQQQNASQPLDHVVSLPPSGPPRPPPAFMSSSSGGSAYDSNYSDQSILPPQSPGLALGGNYQGTFTYEELSRATNGFSEANLLGQGGFGYVFKGILRNGKDIAVKQLKAGSAQGEREFQAEVGIISRVHHRHLVALVGYCIADAQRLLVYEFVPNNTLEFHLHGKGRPPMAWSSRLKIAVGSAKGLSYLHENCNPKIIHRDIKAANILIDFKFEAKVADFGLAKIALDTNTHVSTRVMGTFGYLAPEYAASGKLSEKSDVFSFGVVLLELITGRRPVDTKNVYADNSLVDWARPLLTRALEENNFESLVDTKLNNEYDKEEMARMVACAAASVRHTARRRPRMDQVTRVLEGNIAPSDLNQGIRPGDSNVYSSSHGGSTDYDSNQDNEGMNKFRRGIQEYSVSSEYTNPTSDYDLYSYGWSTDGPNTKEMETDKYEKSR